MHFEGNISINSELGIKSLSLLILSLEIGDLVVDISLSTSMEGSKILSEDLISDGVEELGDGLFGNEALSTILNISVERVYPCHEVRV